MRQQGRPHRRHIRPQKRLVCRPNVVRVVSCVLCLPGLSVLSSKQKTYLTPNGIYNSVSAEIDDGLDRSKADTTDETADDTADIKADEGAAKKKVTCHPYIYPVNRKHTSLRSSKTVGFKSMQALLSHLKRIHDADSESAKEEALRQYLKLHPPREIEPYRPDGRSDVRSDQGADRRVDRGVVRDERTPVETLLPPPE